MSALHDTPDESIRGLTVDLPSVAAKVDQSLRGEVARSRIDALLRDLLERDFRDARVHAYVPILMQRRACDLLRAECRTGAPAPR